MKKPKLIGAIHLVALLGSKKYKMCEKEEAEYFANVKFWDRDDEKLRGDFQVFINSLTPISSMTEDIKDLLEMAKQPTANIEMLIGDAFRRGLRIGKDLAKKKAIEAIEQEK